MPETYDGLVRSVLGKKSELAQSRFDTLGNLLNGGCVQYHIESTVTMRWKREGG